MQKDEDVGRMTMSAPAAVAAAAERFAEQLLEKAAEVRECLGFFNDLHLSGC